MQEETTREIRLKELQHDPHSPRLNQMSFILINVFDLFFRLVARTRKNILFCLCVLRPRCSGPLEFGLSFSNRCLPRKRKTLMRRRAFIIGLDYSHVKAAVLRAYELMPEAYCQKFRKLKKTDNQTFCEFGHEEMSLFDQWCQSQDI